MRKKVPKLFVTDWDEPFSHTSTIDQKNQIFLKEVTLLENCLQRFLALKPSLANEALMKRKGNPPPFLERVLLTRDKIDELLGLLPVRKRLNQKKAISKSAPRSRKEVALTIQSLTGALTQCRNGIETLISQKKERLVPLKKLVPSFGELGGRLLGMKKGLNDILEQTPREPVTLSKKTNP
jgi:hypothetical protein